MVDYFLTCTSTCSRRTTQRTIRASPPESICAGYYNTSVCYSIDWATPSEGFSNYEQEDVIFEPQRLLEKQAWGFLCTLPTRISVEKGDMYNYKGTFLQDMSRDCLDIRNCTLATFGKLFYFSKPKKISSIKYWQVVEGKNRNPLACTCARAPAYCTQLHDACPGLGRTSHLQLRLYPVDLRGVESTRSDSFPMLIREP